MKTLPFENSKHRLLWKLLLHALECVLFPGIPIYIALQMFSLLKTETVKRAPVFGITLLVIGIYYAVTYFTSKIKIMPETSDGRRVFKYILCGIIDSAKWGVILLVTLFLYYSFKNKEGTVYIFNCLFIITFIATICKLFQIWIHALLTRFLETVDKDAEYGYLLSKAYKYKDNKYEKE